jgi:hypothetical protein
MKIRKIVFNFVIEIYQFSSLKLPRTHIPLKPQHSSIVPAATIVKYLFMFKQVKTMILSKQVRSMMVMVARYLAG